MAVSEQTPYIEYTANGSTKSFSLGFDCESQNHLVVLVDDAAPPVGAWSLSNGAVVFGTAPGNGKKITIQRNTPASRSTEYKSSDNSFRPGPINKDFDRIWLRLQELGVADWLLKIYVDRLHQQQEQKIDSLKNYVDLKDDELRAYLMEEIRKQGVALDQLDEYYNYLMQRLAQIAVDKGWDASFVVDGNENQHQINEASRHGLVNKFKTSRKYLAGSIVKLINGQEVVSLENENSTDPNTDMAKWIDNTRTEFSANLVDYLTPQQYKRMLNLDKTLDITSVIQTILTKFAGKRTDADSQYSNAQGICKIRLPKGVFEISNMISVASPLGLVFEGDGVSTTTLLYKKDTGNVFNFTTYLWLKFKSMSIIHQPVSSIKATWTNTLFNLNGTGGGKRFLLEDVFIAGFNIQQKLNNTVNEDTNYASNCQFINYNTFLYSRSSQAVNNSYTRCSWGGVVQRTFDVSNFGHTHISDSGAVQSGTFFYLSSHPGMYGPTAQFTLTNVKFEWMNALGVQSNGSTKIIETDDDIQIEAYFKLTKCGIAGGNGDQAVPHFDIKAGGIIIDVDGGEWAGVNIGVKSFAVGSFVQNRSWIRFANCTKPPNTNIIRTAQNSDSVAPPVIFKNNCGKSDIIKIGSGLANERYLVTNDMQNRNSVSGKSGRLITGLVTETHSVESYGQAAIIDSIRIIMKSTTGATNAKAKVYLDAAKTTLIKEFNIVAQATIQALNVVEAVGLVTSDGVYIEFSNENQNITIPGYIQVLSSSI